MYINFPLYENVLNNFDRYKERQNIIPINFINTSPTLKDNDSNVPWYINNWDINSRNLASQSLGELDMLELDEEDYTPYEDEFLNLFDLKNLMPPPFIMNENNEFKLNITQPLDIFVLENTFIKYETIKRLLGREGYIKLNPYTVPWHSNIVELSDIPPEDGNIINNIIDGQFLWTADLSASPMNNIFLLIGGTINRTTKFLTIQIQQMRSLQQRNVFITHDVHTKDPLIAIVKSQQNLLVTLYNNAQMKKDQDPIVGIQIIQTFVKLTNTQARQLCNPPPFVIQSINPVTQINSKLSLIIPRDMQLNSTQPWPDDITGIIGQIYRGNNNIDKFIQMIAKKNIFFGGVWYNNKLLFIRNCNRQTFEIDKYLFTDMFRHIQELFIMSVISDNFWNILTREVAEIGFRIAFYNIPPEDIIFIPPF